MKTILAALLFVASCSTLIPVTGCAAAIPVIQTVATVTSWIADILDGAEAQVQPRAQEPGAAAVLDAIGKVRKALVLVQDAARGADGIASKDYAVAVEALLDAYQDLIDLGQAFGIKPASLDGRLSAAPGTLAVPPRDEVKARLMAGEL